MLLISIVLLTSFHCHKKTITPGEFYFLCKLDGELYQANSCANCNVARLLGDTVFQVNANRGFETIIVGINDGEKIGVKEYFLRDLIGRQGVYDNSPEVDDIFITDEQRTGILKITLIDRVAKIVEGAFQFDAYNPKQDKVARVTQGKFRMQYSDY